MAEAKKEAVKQIEPNPGLIYSAIPAIMSDIPAIYKDRKNDAQHYNFRGIDDVYNAVNPLLSKHGVFMRADVQDIKREERPSKSGGIMAFVQVRVRYSFVAKDGSFVSTDSLGEGMDSGDKATPKAMSIAQKYAILQMFCIPTADPKDPEIDNPDPAKPINGKPPVEPSRPTSPPVNQLATISSGIKAIINLGISQTEETILGGVRAEIKRLFKRDFAEPAELSVAEQSAAADYLRRWWKHVVDGRKAAAEKHADEDPRPDMDEGDYSGDEYQGSDR
jgi:hypothetical protein